MASTSWEELVRDAPEGGHILQLYRARGFLVKAVAAWIGEGLRRGSGAVLYGEARNVEGILSRLREAERLDPDALKATGRLEVVDAEECLARFMVSGRPDGATFQSLAYAPLRRTRAASGGTAPTRVWGEMVDVLWKRGNVTGARRLEEYWNEIVHDERIQLMCSYEVDNLDPGTHTGPLQDICATHTHLIPEEDDARFDAAVTHALVDVFGELEASTIRRLFASRAKGAIAMPAAEAVLMGLHDASPDLGARVLAAVRRYDAGTEKA